MGAGPIVVVVGIVALGAAAVLWARRSGAPPAAAPGPQVLAGEIEILNECDGVLASVPGVVRVAAQLQGPRGRSVEAATLVTLAPDPANTDGAVRKVGRYRLEAEWPQGAPGPTHWSPPELAREDGSDVCAGAACSEDTRCANVASRPRRIELTASETTHDVQVACICIVP